MPEEMGAEPAVLMSAGRSRRMVARTTAQVIEMQHYIDQTTEAIQRSRAMIARIGETRLR